MGKRVFISASNFHAKARVCVCVCVCVCVYVISQLCLTLHDIMDCTRKPTRFLCSWDSPGKNTGVGSHSLLQRIFLTQGWNPGLLHCRWILYCLSHQGSPAKTLTVKQKLPSFCLIGYLYFSRAIKSKSTRAPASPQSIYAWTQKRLSSQGNVVCLMQKGWTSTSVDP